MVSLKKNCAVCRIKKLTPLLPQQNRLSCLLSFEKASLPGSFSSLAWFWAEYNCLASLPPPFSSAFSLYFRNATYSSSLFSYSFSASFKSVVSASYYRYDILGSSSCIMKGSIGPILSLKQTFISSTSLSSPLLLNILGVTFFSTEVRQLLRRISVIRATINKVKFMYSFKSSLPMESRLMFMVTTRSNAIIKVQRDHVKY